MIESTQFFYNKAQHIEMADEINRLAKQKGVQVSRWQNNSNRRVKITYHVHTAERATQARYQEDSEFTTTDESRRNGKITDETAMMIEIKNYLNSLPDVADETQSIEGFYTTDSMEISGETQYVADDVELAEQYTAYLETFSADDNLMDFAEFESQWDYVDADDIATDEDLRDSLENNNFHGNERIAQFVTIELAKYE